MQDVARHSQLDTVEMVEETRVQLGAPRPAVLLLYLALIGAGVPVWWRTTEVYRAGIPFYVLDDVVRRGSPTPLWCLLFTSSCASGAVHSDQSGTGMGQIRTAGPPTLPVRLVLAKELHGDAGEAADWLEKHVNRHVDPVSSAELSVHSVCVCMLPCTVNLIGSGWTRQVRDGIRVAVKGTELQRSLPDSISDDWEMDEWLKSADPNTKSNSGPSQYTVYMLPEGKKGAFRLEAGGRRLVMGKGMAGWLLVSTDPSKLLTSMQVLPKMLAAVVRGEDQDASSALVEATAAGAKDGAANARFSGEIEAREVGQPSALRVTLSLLVGCTSDAYKASLHQNSSGSRPLCSRGVVGWEAKEAVGAMMQPLLRRLRGTYNLTIDSQVLHYADMAVAPVWDEGQQGYVLKASTLNDFINWRHWSPRPPPPA